MTVLLIPGLLCDRIVWEPLLSRIDAEVADLSTQDDIRDMARDCLARTTGPMKIAGHSMGARVAIEIAAQAPERVTKLALLDTGVHPLKEDEPAKRAEIVQYANDNGMQALADRWLPGMVWEENRKDSRLMADLNAMVLRNTAEQHARQINALVNRPDAVSALSNVTCPTLLIVGRQDQWSPVAQHEEMRKLVPHARLEVVENAGHFAPLEQPDVVARLLEDFFSESA